MASSRSWGIESELLDPAGVKALVPYLDADVILGGFHTPSVGVVDSLRAGTIMRERAVEAGALTLGATTEVLGIDVEDGRVRRVRTDHGDIETETVVIACGVWSPRIARMAGASIPLSPAVHQMISVGPVPQFADTVGEISFPIVRDMDTNMYERQHGGDLEVGSYAHRPILMDADDIPSIAASAQSPTELPFTQEDFELQLEQALELVPDILGDERVGIRYAINGLLSLTPDGMPILGETPEVKGLWSAAAVWIKEAPGIARAVAEWMTHGSSEIDLHASDIARFYDHQRTDAHISARTAEGFNKTYGIVHPMEQWASNRDIRLSPGPPPPAGARRGVLRGGRLGTTVLVRRQRGPARRVRRPRVCRAKESGRPAGRRRSSTPSTSRCATGSAWWTSPHSPSSTSRGPGALDYLQGLVVSQVDVPVGRVVYTPLLSEAGGIVADLTIMRLAHDLFRVVTGGGMGMRDKKWFTDHLPVDGSAQLFDATSALYTLGVWGPRARDLVASVTGDDVSDAGFPFGTCRTIEIGSVRVLASRISYVGELGWEIYVPMEQGLRLWDTLWEAGQAFGVVPVGIGVYATTGRLEKGYRAHGAELELEFDLVEAGMTRPKVKAADFVGKAAYLAQRATPPVAILCTLTLDDPRSSSGIARYMLGREPILALDGSSLIDAKGRRSYVTSAGSGPSVGKHLLMSYLPPAQAVVGTKLLVEYFGERYPVSVAVAGSTPLFDPDNARIRG